MKKNLIKSTLAVAFLTVAGLGGMKAYENQKVVKGDDLLAQNIDALTSEESGSGSTSCMNNCVAADNSNSLAFSFVVCDSCRSAWLVSCSGPSTCH